MGTDVNVSNTPIAPYLGVLNGMNRKEKIAVALYLVDSIPGIELVESSNENISPADEEFLADKLKEMTYSPRIERLFDVRREAADKIDLNDERTSHILGLR